MQWKGFQEEWPRILSVKFKKINANADILNKISNLFEDTVHYSDNKLAEINLHYSTDINENWYFLFFFRTQIIHSFPCKLFSALSTYSCIRSASDLGKVFHWRSNTVKTIFLRGFLKWIFFYLLSLLQKAKLNSHEQLLKSKISISFK